MAFAFSDKAASGIIHDGLPTTFPATAILEIRTGAAPGPGAAPTGTLLASIVLPASPWGAASGRGVPKSGTWSVAAVAAGVAGHFRMKTAADGGLAVQTDPRIEGGAGATGSGADIVLDNTNIAVGQTVTVNSFTVSVP